MLGMSEGSHGSDLACVSVPGRRVPLQLLEALSIPREQLGGALLDLRARAGARELCVISTCERVELYATGIETATPSVLLDALAGNRGVSRRPCRRVHSCSPAATPRNTCCGSPPVWSHSSWASATS